MAHRHIWTDTAPTPETDTAGSRGMLSESVRGRFTSDDAPATKPVPRSSRPLRRRPFLAAFCLLSTPLAIVLTVVLLLSEAVFSSVTSLGETGGHVLVTRDASGSTVRANVDTDGLSQIAAAVESMSGITGSTKMDGNADRLIYWDDSTHGLPDWPIPNGSTSKVRHCFNSALVHCYILATGDYSMTNDKFMAWQEELFGWPSDDVFWPYAMQNWLEKNKGLHMRKLGLGCPGITSKEILYEEVKKELIAGHPMYVGSGQLNRTLFYNSDGTIRKPPDGHAVVIYKYVDGVFYIKDSAGDGGPSVAYPEHGGEIDMFDWIATMGSFAGRWTPGYTLSAREVDRCCPIVFWADDETTIEPSWPTGISQHPDPASLTGPGSAGAGLVDGIFLTSGGSGNTAAMSLASENLSQDSATLPDASYVGVSPIAVASKPIASLVVLASRIPAPRSAQPPPDG